MLDFTLHSWDVIEALGLKDPILVGHSMGGMIAAEMAAIAPNDLSRLALIAPAGLWDDAHPVVDMFATLPFEMPHLLFHDAEAKALAILMTQAATSGIRSFLQAYLVTNARQLQAWPAASLFPIPERGRSRRRLYRIKAKTVVIWGDSDKLIPPVYAHGFKKGIAGAQLVSIPEAGHMVIMEKTAAVVDAISTLGFLAACAPRTCRRRTSARSERRRREHLRQPASGMVRRPARTKVGAGPGGHPVRDKPPYT